MSQIKCMRDWQSILGQDVTQRTRERSFVREEGSVLDTSERLYLIFTT